MGRERARARRAIWGAACLVLALGPACFGEDFYRCVDDGQCVRRGEPGVCVDPGFCAYPDDTCSSGLRFSDLADELASMCTDAGTAETTVASSGPVTSSSSEPGPSSSEAGGETTTPPVPACGDGNVDDGEECDDNNELDGDGCNADCRWSGQLQWSTTIAGDAGERDVAREITLTAGGGVAVTGEIVHAAGDTQLALARLDSDGKVLWELARGDAKSLEVGLAIAQHSESDLFAFGLQDGTTHEAWFVQTTSDGDVVTEGPLPQPWFSAQAADAVGNVLFMAGEAEEGSAFGAVLRYSGTLSWSHDGEPDAPESIFSLDAIADDEAWVTGAAGGDLWLGRVTRSDGIQTVATYAGPAGASDTGQSVIATAFGIAVGGFESTATAYDAVLLMFDESGEMQWAYRPEGPGLPVNDEIEDIALDPDGFIVVAGFAVANDRDAFVARVDPGTGDEMWRRDVELDGANTARAVTVDPSGVIFVAGELEGPDGSSDVWVAAFSP